jgi:hypothetical protein
VTTTTSQSNHWQVIYWKQILILCTIPKKKNLITNFIIAWQKVCSICVEFGKKWAKYKWSQYHIIWTYIHFVDLCFGLIMQLKSNKPIQLNFPSNINYRFVVLLRFNIINNTLHEYLGDLSEDLFTLWKSKSLQKYDFVHKGHVFIHSV